MHPRLPFLVCEQCDEELVEFWETEARAVTFACLEDDDPEVRKLCRDVLPVIDERVYHYSWSPN